MTLCLTRTLPSDAFPTDAHHCIAGAGSTAWWQASFGAPCSDSGLLLELGLGLELAQPPGAGTTKFGGGGRSKRINFAANAAIGDRIDGQPRSGFAFRTVVPTKAVALSLLAGGTRLYVALGAVRSVLCAASLELRTCQQAAISFVYKF